MENPIWRSILWIERFLPTPKPLPPQTSEKASPRRSAYLVFFIIPAALMPALLRNWTEFGAVLRQNIVVAEQVMIGVAVLCALAVVMAGTVVWRRKTHARGDAL